MSQAATLPADAQALLDAKSAEIAAAAKRRQDASGRRDWLRPMAIHKASPAPIEAPKPRAERPAKRAWWTLTDCERGIVAALLDAPLGLSTIQIGAACGIARESVGMHLANVRTKLRHHGIGFLDNRQQGRVGGTFRIIHTTAARGLLA